MYNKSFLFLLSDAKFPQCFTCLFRTIKKGERDLVLPPAALRERVSLFLPLSQPTTLRGYRWEISMGAQQVRAT